VEHVLLIKEELAHSQRERARAGVLAKDKRTARNTPAAGVNDRQHAVFEI